MYGLNRFVDRLDSRSRVVFLRELFFIARFGPGYYFVWWFSFLVFLFCFFHFFVVFFVWFIFCWYIIYYFVFVVFLFRWRCRLVDK